MTHFAYLTALLVAIGGLTVTDRRWRLAFWADWRRATYVIGLGLIVFIAWDVLGIAGGIFAHGRGAFNLPLTIAPEFPLEELFFLGLFMYTALILWRLTVRLKP